MNFNDINIVQPGTIVFYEDRYKYLDQINGVTLISGNSISSYLKKTYNLTTQEYYNLIMYGGVDKTPLCYKCGKPREFIKISHGYKARCKECLNKCHSKTEKTYEVGSKSYKESVAAKELVAKGTHNFLNQSKEERLLAQINSARNTFINRAALRCITSSFMYIGITLRGTIKVGVTFVGLKRRARALKLRTVHLLATGSPTYIADLEQSVKLKFINDLVNSNEEVEFNKLKDIIKFIREIR